MEPWKTISMPHAKIQMRLLTESELITVNFDGHRHSEFRPCSLPCHLIRDQVNFQSPSRLFPSILLLPIPIPLQGCTEYMTVLARLPPLHARACGLVRGSHTGASVGLNLRLNLRFVLTCFSFITLLTFFTFKTRD